LSCATVCAAINITALTLVATNVALTTLLACSALTACIALLLILVFFVCHSITSLPFVVYSQLSSLDPLLPLLRDLLLPLLALRPLLLFLPLFGISFTSLQIYQRVPCIHVLRNFNDLACT
jgi:hypothetical protein